MIPAKDEPPAGKQALRWLRNKMLYSLGFGLVLLTLISVALFHFSDFRKPPPDVVRIAYAAGGPVRKHFLEEMALHGRKLNLDIRLVPTRDMTGTLTEIDEGHVELGLITGAIEDPSRRRVTEITPLYMESLQLVVKAELYEAVSKDFGALTGRSIRMDSPGSSTSLVAGELLSFIGLTDRVTGAPLYSPTYISQADLLAAKDGAALPDAIFQIGGVPSATINRLVTEHKYRLVALPFGGAFNLSKFRQSGPSTPAPGQRLVLNKTFVEEAVIPAFVYGVLPPVPAVDTRTIGSRLMLVGGEQLDNDVVERILTLVMSPEISHIVEPQLTIELLDSKFEFRRHPGTDSYLASLEPFNVDGAFDNYQRMVEIWGILVALYLALANGLKWWKERRDRRRRHSVGDFMSQVLDVEAGVHRAASEDERLALDQRLTDIKKESIELHLEGRLEDSDNLQSLLVTVADARTRIWGLAT